MRTTVFRSLSKWLMLLAGSVAVLALTGCEGQIVGILNPKGIIASEERRLFFDTLALMLIVVLPVIVMSFTFIYHYRASHRLKEYKPNWGHSYFLESLWWGIPCVIIIILAILTWKKTYQLDPYQKIAGAKGAPLVVQVIALPWKWLFIYPEQNIATVNYLVMPVGQEVEYWLTTDNVPMSAFFIPQLGSQIYTMTGMRTQLHLIADQTGTYEGLNTQYNGAGFSDMHFEVHVVEPLAMQQWVSEIKKSSQPLTDATYVELLNPTMRNQPQFFAGVASDLFKRVVDTYMDSSGTEHPRHNQGKFYQIKE